MQTFLIVITIVVIIGCIFFCKLYKELCDKKVNLANFNAQTTQQLDPSLSSTPTGLERLLHFASALQIQLEEVECSDESFKLFNCSYQGDYFTIWASKQNEVIHILTGVFACYPSYSDTYWSIIRYCYHYICLHSFVKVCYAVENRDNGDKEIELHLTYNTMGLSLEGFRFILDNSFIARREITQNIDKLLQDISNESDNLEPAPTDQQEPNMQEIAMQMTMEKANEQKNNRNDNDTNENWSY